MGLRIVNALLYAGLALLAASTIGRPLKLALIAASYRYSYTPDLIAPWVWLILGGALAVILADTARRLALGRKAGMSRYAAMIFVVLACLGARKAIGIPRRVTLEDGMAHLIARAELAADTAFAHEKKYPDRADELTAQWPPELTDLGFFARGAIPLSSRMHVVVTPVYGPILIPPDGVRPGDVVFARSDDGRRYWVTAFVLTRGRLEPMVDSAGRVVVASAIDGHQTSRLDPLFPEYPNKIPHRDPM